MLDGKKSFFILLLAYAALFAACLAFSLFDPACESVIEPMKSSWRMAAAFPPFFGWCLPVTAIALMALAATSPGADAKPSIRTTLSGAFLPGFIMVTILSSLYFFVAPGFEATKALAERESARYSRALAVIDEAIKAEEWEVAERSVNEARLVWDNDPEFIAKRSAVSTGQIKARPKTSAPEKVEKGLSGPVSDPVELYDRAVAAAEAGRWFDAHYYATTAYKLDSSLLGAQRLAAQAWAEINASRPPEGEEGKSELYERKRAAYDLFMAGDALSAYRAFLELSRERPDDPDIEGYLERASATLSGSGFFLDEYTKAGDGVVSGNFAIRVKAEATAASPRAGTWIACARAVRASADSAFFEDLTIVVYGESGSDEILRIHAPYAKLRDRELTLRSVDRDDPSLVTNPEIVPKPGDALSSLVMHDLPFDHVTVMRHAAVSLSVPGLSVAYLFGAAENETRVGGDPEALASETCMRFSFPFAGLILVALAAAAGFRLRWRQPPMPRRYLLLVPVFAASMFPLFESVNWLWRSFVKVFVRMTPVPGLSVTLMVIALSTGVALSLLFLAGSRPHGTHENA